MSIPREEHGVGGGSPSAGNRNSHDMGLTHNASAGQGQGVSHFQEWGNGRIREREIPHAARNFFSWFLGITQNES